jgi:cell division protein FtsW
MIYSTSGVYANQELGQRAYYLQRHVIFLMIGFLLMCSVMAFDYRKLQHVAKPLILISLLMLVCVLIPGIGKASYGARRWFPLGPISFQPSEFAKVAMLIYAADFLSRKQNKIRNFWEGFIPLIVVMGIMCVLILKQPDLGSTVLIACIVLILLFVAGANFFHIGMLGVMALPVLYFLIARVPYRLARIISFLDPWQDSLGAGFQLTQSQIAFGSGGLFGVGLGKSVQKLFYLPAAHTDFILSIIGEELGFVGVFIVITLFVIFIWQGARIAKRTADPFGYFLATGIVVMLGMQAVVNVGVSIGALPTKGLPLPFISYGGSALVFNMIAVGLLLNISRVEEL